MNKFYIFCKFSAFAILGYKYLLGEAGRRLFVLIIPAAFLVTDFVGINLLNNHIL